MAGLDALDLALVTALRESPRAGALELSRLIRVARATVESRLRRMEQAGVITGYRVEVSPAALGLPVTAFVRIRPAAGQLAKIADLARETPEVSECHRISGEDCFLVKVHAPAIEDLEQTLDRFLTYEQTISSIVVSTPVPPRTLPIED